MKAQLVLIVLTTSVAAQRVTQLADGQIHVALNMAGADTSFPTIVIPSTREAVLQYISSTTPAPYGSNASATSTSPFPGSTRATVGVGQTGVEIVSEGQVVANSDAQEFYTNSVRRSITTTVTGTLRTTITLHRSRPTGESAMGQENRENSADMESSEEASIKSVDGASSSSCKVIQIGDGQLQTPGCVTLAVEVLAPTMDSAAAPYPDNYFSGPHSNGRLPSAGTAQPSRLKISRLPKATFIPPHVRQNVATTSRTRVSMAGLVAAIVALAAL